MKILLVEDNPDLLQFASLGLGHLGYEVMTATNGEEAVRMTASHRPDLVVMDMIMPKKDGLEASAEIRRNPATLNIPILVATGMDSSQDRKRALSAGCDGFVSKPYSFAELGSAIRAVVDGRSEPAKSSSDRSIRRPFYENMSSRFRFETVPAF